MLMKLFIARFGGKVRRLVELRCCLLNFRSSLHGISTSIHHVANIIIEVPTTRRIGHGRLHSAFHLRIRHLHIARHRLPLSVCSIRSRKCIVVGHYFFVSETRSVFYVYCSVFGGSI
jgi:hypothetical protein